MEVNAIVILGNTIVELIAIRATCKVLDMRSNALFAISILTLMGLSLTFRASGLPEGLRIAIVSPLSALVLPIALSKGSFRKRISRICLLTAAAPPAEYAATITYTLLSGQTPYPSTGMEALASDYALIYASCILTSAITYEAVIAFCTRADDRSLLPLNLSVIALSLETYLIFGFVSIRIYDAQSRSPLLAVAAFLCTVLSFVISISTLEVAQWDAKATKEHSSKVAIARQIYHVKREIVVTAHVSSSMRKLRHDLANQIGVVNELIDAGHVDVAEQFLLELQVRIHKLVKGC